MGPTLDTSRREARPTLIGLGEAERALSADVFFAAFPWDPIDPDPDRMSAEEFLAAL